MELAELETQRALFFGRLETGLSASVKRVITSDGTIEACYDALRTKFRELRPIFKRRLEVFQLEKSKGQTVEQFVTQIIRMGDKAEVDQMTTDDLYIFWTIYACRHEKELQKELLKLKKPTLAELCAAAEQFEGAEMSAEATTSLTTPIYAVETPEKSVQMDAIRQSCSRCDRSAHADPNDCLARSVECFRCKNIGHISRVCPQRRYQNEKGVQSRGFHGNNRSRGRYQRQYGGRQNDRSPSTANLYALSSSSTPRMELKCQFGKVLIDVDIIPDTGAGCSVFPMRLVPKGTRILPSSMRLRAANGSVLRNCGVFTFVASSGNGPNAWIEALCSPDLHDTPLIGWRDLISLGVLSRNFPQPLAMSSANPAAIAFHATDENTGTTNHKRAVVFHDDRDRDHGKNEEKDNQDVVMASVQNATEEDQEMMVKLQKTINTFADVLCTTLGDAAGTIRGPKMRIELDESKMITPINITTARQVQYHLSGKADTLITELQEANAIVRCNRPTKWCSPAHFVGKPDGVNVRLVTDYRQLNKAVKRTVHPFPSSQDLMRKVKDSSKWFIKLDALHGYFQVPLDEDSMPLTAFLLPSGKWMYTVAPMGLNSSSDEFCRRTDEALTGLDEWLLKIVDDLCIQAPTLDIALKRLTVVLERCRTAGIKLSRKKLQCGQSIKFAGFIISSTGVRPDPAKVAAIRKFPTPTSITELRSFLGLANQLGGFIPDLAHGTFLMRELLKKKNAFVWLPEHEIEFQRARELLCSAELVQPFNPDLPIELLTDSSRLHGLGYALMQREPGGRPRLVQCGSSSLSTAMKNYSTIELEATAVMWAMAKCDFYLRGIRHFTVITDHKPLLGIFSKSLMSLTNNRLQRIREKLVIYSFSLRWVAGKEHSIADALSRAPFFPPDRDMEIPLRSIDVNDPALHFILSSVDAVYAELRDFISSGSMEKLPRHLCQFQGALDSFRVESDVIMAGNRIVVPRPARKRVLDLLHLSHSGVAKTREFARQLYYWPGLMNEVAQSVASCKVCAEMRPSLAHETIHSAVHVATEAMEEV